MKLDTQALTKQLIETIAKLQKYSVFSFIIVFLGIYVFLVYHIGQLINSEAPPQAVTETSTKPISRLQFDKDAVKQMQDLESQNIEVQSLFNQARENPFTE
jgi:Na+-transporting methylmalonyl-CoA/oxaloacetate decarboxylase gamma subunit